MVEKDLEFSYLTTCGDPVQQTCDGKDSPRLVKSTPTVSRNNSTRLCSNSSMNKSGDMSLPVIGPMLHRHRCVLRKCRTALMADLDACDIMDHLVQEGIFNLDMRDRILAQTTRHDRMGKLLDLLERRGAAAFATFLNSLQTDFTHLYHLLKQEDKTMPDTPLSNNKEANHDIYIYGDEIRTLARSQNNHDSFLLEEADVDSGIEAIIYNDVYELNEVQENIKPFGYETPKAAPASKQHNMHEKNFTAVITKDVVANLLQKSCSIHDEPSETAVESIDHVVPPKSSFSNFFVTLGHIFSKTFLFLFRSGIFIFSKLFALFSFIGNLLCRTTVGVPTKILDDTIKNEECKSLKYKKETDTLSNESKKSISVKLNKGDLVILKSQTNETSVVYDIQGQVLEVPANAIALYGDPKGEPWFYPAEISSRQATLLLTGQPEGCFLVYRSTSSNNAVFNLSLCTCQGQIMHYPVFENDFKEVGFSNDKTFLCIQDLVSYYRQNRAELSCRLRLSPVEMKMNTAAKEKIPLSYCLNNSDIDFESDLEIGRGSYAKVVKASYNNKPVAIKIPHANGDQLVERDLLEEATTMMQLDHQNVIKLIGVLPEQPLGLVLEYADQGDLKHWLKNQSSIEPETLLKMCFQVLSVLRYLKNQRFIIHRDIAARNCLVTYDGDLKLSDFGMSRKVVDDFYKAERKEKVPVRWASPEVLSELTYSSQSDIWAAGVLIWELYSKGQTPYHGKSSREVVHYVMTGKRLCRPENCPQEVFTQVQQCWHPSPKRRPSAAQLYDGLVACSYYSAGFTVSSDDDKTEDDVKPAYEPSYSSISKPSLPNRKQGEQLQPTSTSLFDSYPKDTGEYLQPVQSNSLCSPEYDRSSQYSDSLKIKPKKYYKLLPFMFRRTKSKRGNDKISK